jgi:hypothetical protein
MVPDVSAQHNVRTNSALDFGRFGTLYSYIGKTVGGTLIRRLLALTFSAPFSTISALLFFKYETCHHLNTDIAI